MKNINILSKVKYNRYIFIYGVSVLLPLLNSCKKLLMEKPKSVVTENFYNSASEVKTAVNAIYSPLRTNTYPVYIGFLDINTDYGYGRGSYSQVNDFQGFNTNNINRVAGFWKMFYLSILNANLVIKNAPNGNNISDADIKLNVAEAKFLRGLCYFHLVRDWGGVPIRTEENMNQRDLKRSTAKEVYSLIIEDLKYAQSNLPETQKEIGRPTKFSAETLLADVYLTLGQYDDAETEAKDVIASHKYSLVPVQTANDFQSIFGPDVTTTPEEVFYFKYTRQPGQGNYMLWILNHPNTHYFNFGGAYANYGMNNIPFYENWNKNDLRKGMWDTVDFGLGPNTIVCNKYRDQNAVSRSGAGNDLPEYRYSEVLLIYAEAAARAAGHPTIDAMEALNKVHRRAYGKDPVKPSSIDYKLGDYDLNNFIDLIIRERGYEFQFEGKRWFTLKRTGKLKEAIMKNRGISIAKSVFLWPIPTDEFNFNKSLDPAKDQNPGY